MEFNFEHFETIVVGGGHAGTEAAFGERAHGNENFTFNTKL